MLAVLVERGRADYLDIPACKRGLQNVGGIDRALGCARAHNHMQLVNKQDDVLSLLQLFQHALDTLLELTAVFRARNHSRQVERNQALVFQVLRHIARYDFLRKAFGYRRLANAGIADQRGVVLGAAAQDLDNALDFLGSANDRVKLPLFGGSGQILAELLKRLAQPAAVTALAAARGLHVILLCRGRADRFGQRLEYLLRVCSQLFHNAQRHVLPLAEQAV